jgi:hypothetical protein
MPHCIFKFLSGLVLHGSKAIDPKPDPEIVGRCASASST